MIVAKEDGEGELARVLLDAGADTTKTWQSPWGGGVQTAWSLAYANGNDEVKSTQGRERCISSLSQHHTGPAEGCLELQFDSICIYM